MSSLINLNNAHDNLGINQTLSPWQMLAKVGKTFALAAKLLKPDCCQNSAGLYTFVRTVNDLIKMQATNLHVFLLAQIDNENAFQLAIQQDLINYA